MGSHEGLNFLDRNTRRQVARKFVDSGRDTGKSNVAELVLSGECKRGGFNDKISTGPGWQRACSTDEGSAPAVRESKTQRASKLRILDFSPGSSRSL